MYTFTDKAPWAFLVEEWAWHSD